MAADVPHDIFRLVVSGVELPELYLLPLAVVRPESLVLAPSVVADHRVGRVQDRAGGAVVLLQLDDLRILEHVLKVEDIPDVRPTEFVDGLVVIPHHAQVPVFCRQGADKLELDIVRVLVLIHHDVAEALLVIVQHVRLGLQKLHRLHKEVVKIKRVVGLHLLLILLVDTGYPLPGKIPLRPEAESFRGNHLVLGGGDSGQKVPLPVNLRIDLEILTYIPHQRLLVIRVVDGKVGIIAQTVYMPAQDAHAGRVEGADPDALRAKADDIVHPLPHLPGRLVGEGDGQDVPGIDPPLLDEVGDPVGQDPGLPGACPGQDEERALRVVYSLPLLFIQCVVYAHVYSFGFRDTPVSFCP